MRVTDVTKHSAVVRNMGNNAEKMQDLMVGMSTGKRINKPSDDPVGAVISQDYQTSINHAETVSKNIIADRVWLDGLENNITHMGELLKQAKVLALQASNGATSPEARAVIGEEILEIYDELVKTGNAKTGKLYYFSGTKTFTQPLEKQNNASEVEIITDKHLIKSETAVIPAFQSEPIDGLKEGKFQIVLEDKLGGKSTTYTLNLEGDESLSGLVEMINQKAIEEEKYEISKESPTGYKMKLYAQIGVDNSLCIQPEKGYELSFGEDSANVDKILKFGVLGAPEGTYTHLPHLSGPALDAKEYNARFEGFSNEKYTVCISKSGEFDKAQYIVSDDGGKTWSQPKIIKKSIEVYNPDGKPSNNIQMFFNVKESPFFWQGTKFQFNGNPVVKYMGNADVKEVLLHNGIKTPISVTADELFFKADKDSVNVLDVLYNLAKSMQKDDQVSITKSIGELDLAIDQVLSRRAKVGVIGKQVEVASRQMEEESFTKTKELAELEDLDLPKAVMDLNSAEARHQASLDAGARLIQPTLISFLK